MSEIPIGQVLREGIPTPMIPTFSEMKGLAAKIKREMEVGKVISLGPHSFSNLPLRLWWALSIPRSPHGAHLASTNLEGGDLQFCFFSLGEKWISDKAKLR